jgi:DNA-binding MarR family transcriptional regulator
VKLTYGLGTEGAVLESGTKDTDNERRDASDELAAQLGELVSVLSRRLRRSSKGRLVPFGLTDGQARVLRILGRAPSPLRMSEIARRIEIVPRSATTVVEGLEEKGLVSREIDLEDRRSILVRPTAAGSRLLDELRRARADAAVALFGDLAPVDRLTLFGLLSQIDPTDRQQDLGPRTDDIGGQPSADHPRTGRR